MQINYQKYLHRTSETPPTMDQADGMTATRKLGKILFYHYRQSLSRGQAVYWWDAFNEGLKSKKLQCPSIKEHYSLFETNAKEFDL